MLAVSVVVAGVCAAAVDASSETASARYFNFNGAPSGSRTCSLCTFESISIPVWHDPCSNRAGAEPRGAMARKYGKKASKKVERAMRERKQGKLRSGRSGKKVTSRKQAIAIGLAEARKEGAKVPPKKKSSKKTPSKRKTSQKKTS